MTSTIVQHLYNWEYSRNRSICCRTCLGVHNDMSSIFAVDDTYNVLYSEIVSSVTGFKIAQDDGLTTYICNNCMRNAKSAYEYRLQAWQADTVLRSAPAPARQQLQYHEQSVNGALIQDTDKPQEVIHIKDIERIDAKASIESKCKIESDITIKMAPKINNVAAVYVDNKGTNVKAECADYDDGAPAVENTFNPVHDYFMKKEPKKEMELPIVAQECTNCGIVFDSLLSLQHHSLVCMKAESAVEMSNYCPVCGECFGSALTLLQHARTHDHIMTRAGNKAKYSPGYQKETSDAVEYVQDVAEHPRCGVCSTVFDAPLSLHQHLLTHSFVTVTACSLCDKLFLELFYLKRHYRTGHNDEDVATSAKMGGKVRASYLGDLMREHNQASSDIFYLNVCPHCGQLTLSVKDLIEHNATEHPEFCYRCLLCSKLFRDAKRAVTHRRLCVSSERPECTICKQKFACETHLSKHVQSKHKAKDGDDKTKYEHPCYICGKQFSTLEAVDKHKFRTHRKKSEGEKIFECDICHTKVRDKTNLANHIRVHDPLRKPAPLRHLCRFCGMSFRQAANQAVHIRRCHTGEKPFACRVCGKAFAASSDRQRHERAHTGIKPYTCQICGISVIKLKEHMRVHTGERPFKCSHCGQAFTQKQDMRKHERRHTGESAYTCSDCGGNFMKLKDMREHKEHCAVANAPSLALTDDPHLLIIKEQMEFARSQHC